VYDVPSSLFGREKNIEGKRLSKERPFHFVRAKCVLLRWLLLREVVVVVRSDNEHGGKCLFALCITCIRS